MLNCLHWGESKLTNVKPVVVMNNVDVSDVASGGMKNVSDGLVLAVCQSSFSHSAQYPLMRTAIKGHKAINTAMFITACSNVFCHTGDVGALVCMQKQSKHDECFCKFKPVDLIIGVSLK